MSIISWLDRKLFPPQQRAEWGSVGITPPPRHVYSVSGNYVSTATAMGLATAGAALKLVSESVGIMPLKVYQGEKPEVTEARDSWQWFRLKEQPNDDQSAFDFWTDAANSVETYGDAFIWKNLVRRPVRGPEEIELYLLDPSRVMVKRDEQNRKYYEIRRGGGRIERVPAAQILQVRGWTGSPGADRGMSTISQYADTFGNALASQEYAGRFYSQGTTIPGVISVPGNPSQDELDAFRDNWVERHGGGAGAFVPAVLGGGSTWQPTGITMRDAQYIETQQWSAEEVCRAMRVTPQMLGLELENSKGADDDVFRFMTVDMAPRYRRIELAVGRDPDLFPAGSEMFPEFLLDAFYKPSLEKRMAAYKNGIQAGIYVADEPREKENLPPLPDGAGKIPQITPVGGAPNPGANEAPESQQQPA